MEQQEWGSRGDLARRYGVTVLTIHRWVKAGKVEKHDRPGQHPQYRMRPAQQRPYQGGTVPYQGGTVPHQKSYHQGYGSVSNIVSSRDTVPYHDTKARPAVTRIRNRAAAPKIAQVEQNLAELRAAPKPKARPRPAPKVAPATETVQELLRIVAAAKAEAPAQSNSTSSAQSNSTSSAGSVNPEWVWFTLGTILSGGVTWWAIRDFKRRHQVELRRARRRLIQQRKVVELAPVRRRLAARS